LHEGQILFRGCQKERDAVILVRR